MDTAWLSLVNTWKGPWESSVTPYLSPCCKSQPQRSRGEDGAVIDHSILLASTHLCSTPHLHSTYSKYPSTHPSIHTVSRSILTRKRVRHTVPPQHLTPTPSDQHAASSQADQVSATRAQHVGSHMVRLVPPAANVRPVHSPGSACASPATACRLAGIALSAGCVWGHHACAGIMHHNVLAATLCFCRPTPHSRPFHPGGCSACSLLTFRLNISPLLQLANNVTAALLLF